MSLLLDGAPRTVRVDGRDWEIRSDHRTGIRVTELLERSDLSDDDKLREALCLYYPVLPGNLAGAMRAMLWFYRCGKPAERQGASAGSAAAAASRIFDIELDAPLVYAAFLEQYGVDLEKVSYLHWWKFKAMLDAAGSETQLRHVMEIRAMNVGRMKGEQKRHYQQLQKLYALPLPPAEQERIDALTQALLHGGKVPEELRRV